MDDLDRAEEEIEMELAEALRQRKPYGPQPTGFCFWCGDPVDNGMRRCDRACEASREYETERKAANRGQPC